MPESTIDIGVRVNMDEAAQLEALPKSIQARWEEVSKTLRGVSGLTGAARERVARGSERMTDVLGKAETQGGFTSAQRREFERNFKETARILDRGFVEQINVAKTKGKQLEQELASVAERLAKAKGKEKEALQKTFTEQFKAFGEFEAQGGNKAALDAARASRRQFRTSTQEAEDFAALIPTVAPGTRAEVDKKLQEHAANTFGMQINRARGTERTALQTRPAASFIGPPAPSPLPPSTATVIKAATPIGAMAGTTAGTAAGTAAATGATAAIGAAAKAGATAGATAGTAAGARAGAAAVAGFGGGTGYPGAAGFGPGGPYVGGAAGGVPGGQYPGGPYPGSQPFIGPPDPRSNWTTPSAVMMPGAGANPASAGAGGAAGFLKSFGRGMIGASVIGGGGYLAASMVRREFRSELERGMRASDLAQQIKPRDMGYDEFRDRMKDIHPSFTPDESTQFVERFGQVGGSPNVLGTMPGAGGSSTQAAEMTRRLGFTPEEGAQRFGQAEQLGLGGSEQKQKKLAELIGDAVARGQMQGRQGEVFDSILRLGEAVVTRTGTALNAEPLQALLTRLAQTGEPGLKGQFGAGVVERIDDSLNSARMLKAFPPAMIQAAVMRTMPGIQPARMDEMLEGGIKKFPEEFGKVIKTMLAMVGNNENTRAMVANTLGIPLGARDNVFAAVTKGGGAKEITAALAPAPVTPEAKIREDIAELRKKEADAVSALILPYKKLLDVVNDAIPKLQAFHEGLTQRLIDAGVPKETASTVAGGAMGAGALYGAGKLWSGAKSLLFPSALANAGTAAEAATAAGSIAKWNPLTLAKGTPWGMLAGMTQLSGDNPVDANVVRERRQRWNQNLGAAIGSAPTDVPPPHIPEAELSKKKLPDSILDRLSEYGSRVSGAPAALIRSVIQQESRGNPNIVSPKGAQGLMQLMPSSHPEMSDAERFDPVKNVAAGSKHLARNIKEFGSVEEGLAAYNAGSGAVRKYGGVPPYKETQEYVSKVTTDTERRLGTARAFMGGQNFLPQEKDTQRNGEKKLSFSIDPLTVIVRNEKGEVLSTHQAPLTATSRTDFNLHTAPGGSGMHAQTNSPFFGNYH